MAAHYPIRKIAQIEMLICKIEWNCGMKLQHTATEIKNNNKLRQQCE